MPPQRLRILVYPESPRRWAAQALEHDLAARGWTIESAIDTLVRITRAHVEFDRRHNHPPLSAFGAAPRPYWKAFNTASPLPIFAEVEWTGGVPAQIVTAVTNENPVVSHSARPS
jgi:hypothetical protein